MSAPEAAAPAVPEPASWQDVEFGAYAADLPLWVELGRAADGPVLELGAGTGRVTLHLAAGGLEMIALERDTVLLGELDRRAERRGLSPRLVEADLTSLADAGLPSRPGASIAPLHVVQSLDPPARVPMLAALRGVLSPGAVVAFALVDESSLLAAPPSHPSAPEMREIEGWVYSSEPLWVQATDGALRVRRLRQRVSPSGEMERTVHDDVLHRLSRERLDQEAEAAGFRTAGTRPVDSGPNEADSVVVLLEAV